MNIDCLIPYFRENLITFPLTEEGDFRPVLTIDFIFDVLPDKSIIENIKSDNAEFWQANDTIKFDVKTVKSEASEYEFCGINMNLKEKFTLYFEIYDGADLLFDNLGDNEINWESINEQINTLVIAAKFIIDYIEKIKT